jgi:GR25 family glycosyltransferase involved in LPS biosynthesis
MKYAIIHVNDRAIKNINYNKGILGENEYLDDIEYFDGNINNGWNEINRLGISTETWKPYDGRNFGPLPGEYGVWISTIRALQYMVDNKIDTMLLLEDDITLLDDFVQKLELCVNDLPNDFDFLSLFCTEEQNTLDSTTDIGSLYIHRSKKQFAGALAMLYSLKGAKKILKIAKRFGMEYTSDCFIYHYSHTNILNGYSIQNNSITMLINNDYEIKSLIDPSNIRHGKR